MTRTLLIRLAAPLQSWGVASNYLNRDTASEPTKSGVIGLLASALGRGRDESIDDLASLRIGVRVDQPGKTLRDYQTAATITKLKKRTAHIMNKYYISDAVYLVAIEGNSDLINTLVEALKSPYYSLYLGRRSCPATGNLIVGVVEEPFIEALKTTPWQASSVHIENCLRKAKYGIEDIKQYTSIRVVYDSGKAEGYIQQDVPVTFSWKCRKHGKRYVKELVVPLTEIYPELKEVLEEYEKVEEEHDPMGALPVEEEHDPMAHLGGGE